MSEPALSAVDPPLTSNTPQSPVAPTSSAEARAVNSKPEPGKFYSPFFKKLITKVGETIDLSGKATIGFAAINAKPGHVIDLANITQGQWALFGVGGVLVVIGLYLQAEAER